MHTEGELRLRARGKLSSKPTVVKAFAVARTFGLRPSACCGMRQRRVQRQRGPGYVSCRNLRAERAADQPRERVARCLTSVSASITPTTVLAAMSGAASSAGASKFANFMNHPAGESLKLIASKLARNSYKRFAGPKTGEFLYYYTYHVTYSVF